MAKTLVIDTNDGSQIPFLRGILIRSLQEAGLEFEPAYRIAATVRQQLDDSASIPAPELRELVVGELRRLDRPQVLAAYLQEERLPPAIQVIDREGQGEPFTNAELHARLESCGLSPKLARRATLRIYQALAREGTQLISSNRLGRLTYDHLLQHLGKEPARRYLAWCDYLRSSRPLILLIGGTTGCGKSTIATEVAHRIGVVRTQSTDMLREVMRTLLPEPLLPGLHRSAFEAWETLGGLEHHRLDRERLITDGYHNQTDLVTVACEAVIQRALRERISLILEGVHVHPAMGRRIQGQGDALIVSVMLTVLKPDRLKKRLRHREHQAPQRASERYLDHFEPIWELQSYLLSEADRCSVPIIDNRDHGRAAVQVLSIIVDTLVGSCKRSPDEVFRPEA